MSVATALERGRLGDTFARLCRAYSPSGNLLVRIPGSGDGSVLLCAHLDTVPANAAIEPVLRDGTWQNANDTILGADNKAAVAVLLALAARLVATPHEAGVELLFTIGEEVGLIGAKEFEIGVLRSPVGYTFDAAVPLGSLIVASPTYYRLSAELQGVAAHAGVQPEAGRSAILAAAAAARGIAQMQLGRIDAETTANIGTISGGSAANVVPDRCRLVGEARSIDAGRAEELASHMVALLADAANDPECECDLDVTLERVFDGYRVRGSAPELVLAREALAASGYTPMLTTTGGGSDVNALRTKGCAVLNLGNGTEHPHEPTESVSSEALEGMLEVALALVDRAA